MLPGGSPGGQGGAGEGPQRQHWRWGLLELRRHAAGALLGNVQAMHWRMGGARARFKCCQPGAMGTSAARLLGPP